MEARSLLPKAKEIVLLVTAIGLPLVFFGRHEDEPFNITKLALLLAGVSIAAALHLVQIGWGHRTRVLRRTAPIALALTMPLMVSWLASPYREWALWGEYSRFNGLLPYIAFAILGVLLVDAFWDKPAALARALSVVGGVVGAYAIVQVVGLDPMWTPGLDSGSPYPPSSIGHFNFVGGFLGVALPVSLYRWLSGDSHSWEGMTSTVFTTTGLILSNSQGGWAAGVAGVVIVIGSFAQPRWSAARFAGRWAAVLVAAGVILAVSVSAGSPDPLFGGTAKSRGLLWGTALEMGADHPLVGRGPATYAVEGVRYRDLDYILLERNSRADDPHSVPLSFWANAGALGLAGFLMLAAWIWRAGTRGGSDHLRDAFFASCVGYLVQSLVSIDVLTLRAGLSISLAGLAITSTRHSRSATMRTRPVFLRIGIAALAIAVAAAGAWYSVGLLRAHRSFADANDHFRQGRIDLAIERSEDAIGYRFEPRYLVTYGRQLAVAALKAGPPGKPLIDRMEDVYAYLDRFPDSSGFIDAAQGFHDWAHFEPSASEKAIFYLRSAKKIDPANPDIDLRLAEALVRAGRYSEALAALEDWPVELDASDAYWATLSIARLFDGDADGASLALAEAEQIDPTSCRVMGASEVLQRYESRATDISPEQDFLIRYNCSLGGYFFMTDMAQRAAKA